MEEKKTNKGIVELLLAKMAAASEIPITETADIHSKGIYMSRDGKHEIYLKQSLTNREKLKVLLHEYGHYVHLTHYFKDESRAECEIIANGAAFFICEKFGLKIYKAVDLNKFSDNTDVVVRLTTTIQAVAEHIISGIN